MAIIALDDLLSDRGDEVEEDEGSDHRATPQGDEGVDQGGQTITIHSPTSFPHL